MTFGFTRLDRSSPRSVGTRFLTVLFQTCLISLVLACGQTGQAQDESGKSGDEAESNQESGSEQESPTATSDEEFRYVAGSRLLSPVSFKFTIPTAHVQKSDLDVVSTVDQSGKQVIAKVHCKVGDNYVVLLPNGWLVDRMADKVQASDRKFKARSHQDVGREVLANELSRFSGMRIEKSKHYVYLYNTSPGFKTATRGILESMYSGVKGYAKNMGLDTHHPEVPLVVIMFSTRAEFRAYRPDIGSGVAAFYDMVSNQIVLCEESVLADTRPDLARGQLLSTIAHEGAHQILHNIGVQQRLSMWPMWMSEGLAEFFAPTSLGNRNRWKGAGEVNDLRMFELESFLQTRFLEGFDGRTINEAVTAGRLDSTGYAKAWSIVHFLVKQRRKKFYELVVQMSELKPMRGMVARPDQPVTANLEHFRAFFGEDSQQFEIDMVEYLGGLADYDSPVAGFFHYVGLAEVIDDGKAKRYACFFHTQEKVDAWKAVLEETLAAEGKSIARWDVQRANNRANANVLIGRFLN